MIPDISGYISVIPFEKQLYCWCNVVIAFQYSILDDGLVQERRNSSALAMELCLSWINPLYLL